MAHSQKVKAAAVSAIIEGVPWDEVQAKYKVGRATLHRWMIEVKAELGTELSRDRGLPAKQAASREEFVANLGALLARCMEMLNTWAKTAGDEEFVRKHTTDAIALGDRVLDRVDNIVDKLGGAKPSDG